MGFIMNLCHHIVVLDAGAGDRDRHAGRGPGRTRRSSRPTSAPAPGKPSVPRPPHPARPPVAPVALGRRPGRRTRPSRQPRPESDRPIAVQLDGVSAGYGGIDVLQDISLTVRAGEVCAVLGPNGAGKSTALKVMSGQLAPTKGTASHQRPVDRRRPDRAPGPRRAVRGPGGAGDLPEPHRGREPQDGQLRRGRATPEILEKSFQHFPKLAERRTQLAGKLSGGEQQMLSMARALAVNPSVLLRRRAVDGPRAQDRRGTVRGARRASPGRASRSWWWSSSRPRCSRWPTPARCSSTGGSPTTAPPTSWPT